MISMKCIFQICAFILFSMTLMKQAKSAENARSFIRSTELRDFSHGNFFT